MVLRSKCQASVASPSSIIGVVFFFLGQGGFHCSILKFFFIFIFQFSIKFSQFNYFPASVSTPIWAALALATAHVSQQWWSDVTDGFDAEFLLLPFLGHLGAEKSLVPPTRVIVRKLVLSFFEWCCGFARGRGTDGVGPHLAEREAGVSSFPMQNSPAAAWC